MKSVQASENLHNPPRPRSLDDMADEYYKDVVLVFEAKQMGFMMDRVLRHLKGPRVLELGIGNGRWTRRLVAEGFDVTAVEGSSLLIQKVSKEFEGRAQIIHSMFETYEPKEPFDSVIAACVLEHVADAPAFLRRIGDWLKSGGDLHATVPNAHSLHRRVGLCMGMIQDPLELSPTELAVGHCRSYTREIFEKELVRGGFEIDFVQGVFVKPLSSPQLVDWSDDILKGYDRLADTMPDCAAFLYAHCSKK